jgi:hypothetical protein
MSETTGTSPGGLEKAEEPEVSQSQDRPVLPGTGPGGLEKTETPDMSQSLHRRDSTALAAAYQVTARLSSAEQTTIWARLAGVAALAPLSEGLLSHHYSPFLQIIVGLVGLVITAWFWPSFERSFNFRDHFARLMKAQEERLGIAAVGPLTQGESVRSSSSNVATQRNAFRVIFVLLLLGYVAVLCSGVWHLARACARGITLCCGS